MEGVILAVSEIQDFIRQYTNRLFPGCIVGIADEKRNFLLAEGTQDSRIEMKETNIFDIASITKAFLHILTLKLIPINELDQRVIEYLPDMYGEYREDITVRHLLTFGVEYGSDIKLSELRDREVLIRTIMEGDLTYVPGSTYRYTNISSMLLSIFLENKFGKSFEFLMKKYVLEPLGLNKTGFDPTKLNGSPLSIIPTEKKLPRGVLQDESARLYGQPIGSAGLFSTVGDLLKFGQSFIHGEYIPIDTIEQMSKAQFSNTSSNFGLGMGLFHENECGIADEEGRPVVVLKKNGFSGVHFCVLPNEKFCFVVFGNICYPIRPSQEKRDEFTNFHKKLLDIVYKNRKQLLS